MYRNFLLYCGLLTLAIQAVNGAAPSCRGPRLRKEIRDLTPEEWRAFVQGIISMKASGSYNRYIQIHQQFTDTAHGGQFFLPWHRRFIYDFETELMGIANGTLKGLPYLDTHSSYNIFSPQSPYYVGGTQGCVTDGPFAGFRDLTNQCVNRAYNGAVTAADPRVIAALILSGSDFPTYSDAYENGQHAQVHQAIGGHMANVMISVSDPLFWLHHSMVDYVWYKRQWADPNRLYWDIQGTHGGQPVNLRVALPGPWQTMRTVGENVDTYWQLCYDYQDPRPPTAAQPGARPAPGPVQGAPGGPGQGAAGGPGQGAPGGPARPVGPGGPGGPGQGGPGQGPPGQGGIQGTSLTKRQTADTDGVFGPM